MRIELTDRQLLKAVDAIEELESMDFPEITDGNKQSKLFGIISILKDFSIDVLEEIDQ